MADQVGAAYVPVRPDMRGFHQLIQRELGRAGEQIGQSLADAIRRGFGGEDVFRPFRDQQEEQRRRAPREGDDQAGAFARSFQRRLRAAFRSLPQADIDADTSQAQRQIAELRARMATLSEKRIGVDIQTADALREMAQIHAALQALGAETADVQVQTDTAAAIAQLAAVQAEVDKLQTDQANVQVDADTAGATAQLAITERQVRDLDGRTANVNVNADVMGALAGIASVRTAIGGLGLLAGPQIVAIGAGVAGLAGPLAAAGAGFGGLAAVALPSIGRVGDALKAQETASKAAGAAGAQAQQRALAQAGAQQQLATAVRNAAAAHKQALEGVRQAEQQVTQAQQAAAQAQRALNDARATAVRQAQDLSNQVTDARLSERQGVFDLADAEKELNQVKADPKATQDQIARAQLAYDRAEQQLAGQRLNLQRLIADEKAAARAGVDGSDVVRNARDRLAEANARITESERALAAARANVSRVDQQGAEQAASARRAMAQAALQAASGNTALATSLAALSPLERQVMVAWQGLTTAFADWGRALQPAVLPLLIQGIDILRSSLPLLTPLVKAAAGAVGGFLGQLGTALKSPFWTGFFATMTKMAGPAISMLGSIALNAAKGIAGLMQAFAPIGMAFLGVLDQAVAAFAKFTTSLISSPGFQQFATQMIQILSTMGGQWAATLGQMAPIVLELFQALAPLLGALRVGLLPIMSALVPVAGLFISTFAMILRAVTPLIAPLGQLIAALLRGLMPVIQPLVGQLQMLAGQALAQLISAVIDSLPSLLQLGMALITLLPSLLQMAPLFLQWAVAFTPLIPPLTQLIALIVVNMVPVLRLLMAVARVVLTYFVTQLRMFSSVATVILTGAAKVFSSLGQTLRSVWSNTIKPALVSFGGKVREVWDNWISPAFAAIKSGVSRVADSFHNGVSAIGTAWDKLKSAARTPVAFVIDHVFNGGILKMWNAVAKLVPGVGRLDKIAFDRGGVVPGYSPGRDIHQYYSPTGGRLDLSGGESVMRPEFTRGVGERWVHGMNYLARTKGTGAVVRALGLAGDPSGFPASAVRAVGADAGQRRGYALGGIIDRFVSGAKGFFADGLVKSARKVVDPLLNAARGAIGGTPFGDLMVNVPKAMLDRIIGHFGSLEGRIGGPGQRAVQLARTQVAKRVPYVWGGTTWDVGLDCSGLVQQAWKRADPLHRTMPRTTYTQRPWLQPVTTPRPGDIGQPHPGHTFLYAGNGKIIEEPYTGATAREVPARPAWWGRVPWKFDDGGYLEPGLSLVANYTRKPEPVFTHDQFRNLAALRTGNVGGATYNVYPREARMTEAGLERLTRRRDALARIGRPV